MSDVTQKSESSISFARELNALRERAIALEAQLKRCEIQVGTFMAYLLTQYPSAQSLSGHQLSAEVMDFNTRFVAALNTRVPA